MWKNQYSKAKGWNDGFLVGFLEGHNVWQNNLVINHQDREIWSVAIMVTKPDFLVAKDEMLVALVTVSVAISGPGMPLEILYYACVKPAAL